jgi:formylmethanofuran dehydrogenase subunit E
MSALNQQSALFQTAMAFHGHKCPAMPLGLRAALAAMEKLGVERAQNQELRAIAETGKAHAMGCFLDGIMSATGCTYGKANIEKRYWNKLAFTLIETATGRAVRVAVKPEVIDAGLKGPFVARRKQGVPPQDVDPAIVDPLVDKALSRPVEELFDISEVFQVEVGKASPVFEAVRCARCGEAVFVSKARLTPDGRTVCLPCSGYAD